MDIPFPQERLQAGLPRALRANKLAEGYLRPLVFFGVRRAWAWARSNPVRRSRSPAAVGRLPRRRGAQEGHPRQGLVVHAAARRTSVMVRAKVMRPVRELVPRQARGDARPATRRPSCSTPRATSPRARARTSSSSRTACSTRRRSPRRCSPASRATRCSASPGTRASRSSRRSSRATTMYLADELFMTGTAAEVTPVREVDNRRDRPRRARPGDEEDPGDVLPRGPRRGAAVQGVADVLLS